MLALGRAYFALGDFGRATEYFKRTLAAQPGSEGALQALQRIRELGMKR